MHAVPLGMHQTPALIVTDLARIGAYRTGLLARRIARAKYLAAKDHLELLEAAGASAGTLRFAEEAIERAWGQVLVSAGVRDIDEAPVTARAPEGYPGRDFHFKVR